MKAGQSKGVVIALDIESRGMSPKKHGILSIGMCIGSAEEDLVLIKKRFDLEPLPGQQMEKRCQDEFWSKHQDIYAILTQDPKPVKEVMTAFRAIIDKWHAVAEDVYLVSDNPAFDFGLLNYYLDEFDLLPLSYKRNKEGKPEYVALHDSDSYARGALGQGFNAQWVNDTEVIKEHLHAQDTLNKDSHNHLPEKDAEFIYRLHYQVVNKSPLKRAKTSE